MVYNLYKLGEESHNLYNKKQKWRLFYYSFRTMVVILALICTLYNVDSNIKSSKYINDYIFSKLNAMPLYSSTSFPSLDSLTSNFKLNGNCSINSCYHYFETTTKNKLRSVLPEYRNDSSRRLNCSCYPFLETTTKN